jgi:hypothetical protein
MHIWGWPRILLSEIALAVGLATSALSANAMPITFNLASFEVGVLPLVPTSSAMLRPALPSNAKFASALNHSAPYTSIPPYMLSQL